MMLVVAYVLTGMLLLFIASTLLVYRTGEPLDFDGYYDLAIVAVALWPMAFVAALFALAYRIIEHVFARLFEMADATGFWLRTINKKT